MTRTNPYPMNDPKDYSMLTQPKLRLNDTVIVWDEDEGGEWVQARVVDATFHRREKQWIYSAITEYVDCPSLDIDRPESILLKQWHCFSDDELECSNKMCATKLSDEMIKAMVAAATAEQINTTLCTHDMYIVIKK